MEEEIVRIFVFSTGEKKDGRLMPASQSFGYVGLSLSVFELRAFV